MLHTCAVFFVQIVGRIVVRVQSSGLRRVICRNPAGHTFCTQIRRLFLYERFRPRIGRVTGKSRADIVFCGLASDQTRWRYRRNARHVRGAAGPHGLRSLRARPLAAAFHRTDARDDYTLRARATPSLAPAGAAGRRSSPSAARAGNATRAPPSPQPLLWCRRSARDRYAAARRVSSFRPPFPAARRRHGRPGRSLRARAVFIVRSIATHVVIVAPVLRGIVRA